MSKISIKAKNDYRTFKAGDEYVFDFEDNVSIFFVGKNGCGKSTLVNAIRGSVASNKSKLSGFETGLTTESYKQVAANFEVETDFEKVFILSAETDDPLSWANAAAASSFISCGGWSTNHMSTGQRQISIFNKFFKDYKDKLDDKTLVIFDECDKGMDLETQRMWCVMGGMLWQQFGCKTLKITHNVFEISRKNQIYSFKDKSMVDTKQYLLDTMGFEIEKPKFIKKK